MQEVPLKERTLIQSEHQNIAEDVCHRFDSYTKLILPPLFRSNQGLPLQMLFYPLARFLQPRRGGVEKQFSEVARPSDNTARTDCVNGAKNGSRNEVNGAWARNFLLGFVGFSGWLLLHPLFR